MQVGNIEEDPDFFISITSFLNHHRMFHPNTMDVDVHFLLSQLNISFHCSAHEIVLVYNDAFCLNPLWLQAEHVHCILEQEQS